MLKIRNEKRVFILGAGFSTCCGVPITSELLSDLLRYKDINPIFKEGLEKFMRSWIPEKELIKPEVEKILEIMDTIIGFGELIGVDEAIIRNARKALLSELCKYLWQFVQKPKENFEKI